MHRHPARRTEALVPACRGVHSAGPSAPHRLAQAAQLFRMSPRLFRLSPRLFRLSPRDQKEALRDGWAHGFLSSSVRQAKAVSHTSSTRVDSISQNSSRINQTPPGWVEPTRQQEAEEPSS